MIDLEGERPAFLADDINPCRACWHQVGTLIHYELDFLSTY